MISVMTPEPLDNVVREYHHENGSVYLCHGKQFYYYVIEKQETPARAHVHERGRMDYITAHDFFDVACRYIRDEIKWTEPIYKFSCKYNQKHSRGCTDLNCPKCLGGADYRFIFGVSCPFRKIPRTR